MKRFFFWQIQLLENRRFSFHFDITDHQTGEGEKKNSSDHSLLTVSGAEGHVSPSNVELRLSKVSGGAIHPSVHMHMQNAVATWLRPSVRIGGREGGSVSLGTLPLPWST